MDEPVRKSFKKARNPLDERACRKCGCTYYMACAGGCFWVAPDLCSACAPTKAEKMIMQSAASMRRCDG